MNRLSEIEIAGRIYPLNFSTKAAKQISERYDGLENLDKAFASKNIDAMMDEVIWLLALLIEQGVAYKKIVDGEDVKAISADALEVVLGVADFAGIKNQITDALLRGMSREVEVEIDPKNAKTTQGK